MITGPQEQDGGFMVREEPIAPLFCTCLQCGKAWWSRILTLPKECPKCKSYNWNIPKKSTSIDDKTIRGTTNERAERSRI